MTIHIDYESVGFPAGGPVLNGYRSLATSWDELLWAAVTVGRPNRHYVFRHGLSSTYEALFRWSLVRMALEQSGPRGQRLYRTAAARTLDPSEKGAVNYFLGLAISKLFASRLLNTPWLLHLDVFRPRLNPVLTGRSRPDLIGEILGGGYISLECKGRVSAPDTNAQNKAKQQAQRVVTVNGVVPTYHIGGIAFFKNERLQFYWKDPESNPRIRNAIEVKTDPSLLRFHYGPVLELIQGSVEQYKKAIDKGELFPLEELDIRIGIHPELFPLLMHSDWGKVHDVVAKAAFHKADPFQQDGLAVVAGEKWLMPFEEEF